MAIQIRNTTHILYVVKRLAKSIITLPLSTARAAANSDCGTTPLSAPKVLPTVDRPDGTEMPCEFSPRTKKTYEVAGFSSLICKKKSERKVLRYVGFVENWVTEGWSNSFVWVVYV